MRQRSTTTVSDDPSDTATDEEVQQKISELFKRKGYSNPDPDPEDQLLEESGSQIEARIVGFAMSHVVRLFPLFLESVVKNLQI